eukprot:gene9179-10153_t
MALKLLGIFFLLVAAVYAAPSAKNEVDEPYEMDEADEALDDPIEKDPEEIEQDEDDEDEPEEDAKSKPKYHQMSMQDVQEHVAALSDAISKRKRFKKF